MTNLNILDQYVLCLHGTATKILELSLGSRDFLSAVVAASTMSPGVPDHESESGIQNTNL